MKPTPEPLVVTARYPDMSTTAVSTRAPPKVPLNLYLLRHGVTPAGAVISYDSKDATSGLGVEVDPSEAWQRSWILQDGEEVEAVLPDSREGPPSLLVRSTPATVSWQTILGDLVPNVPLAESQRNQGALLFQTAAGELVVWSFGNAWPLLDPSGTVERFGLRAGLNALLSTPAPSPPPKRPKDIGVRGLTAAIRAAVVRKSTVHTARPSKPSTMERVDQSSDAASMAELTTHHDVFDRISAGRSLRFEASVSGLSDLEKYAAEAIRLFKRSDYTTSDDYSWIDYTVPVSNKAEIDGVLDKLWVDANGSPPLAVDLVWAETEPDTGRTPSFVCLPHEQVTPTSSKRTELPWKAIQQWLNAKTPNARGHEALRTKLRFYHDDLSSASAVELWHLAVAQLSLGPDSFMISDGEVWRASQSHVKDIDRVLKPHVTVNPSYLPPYVLGEPEAVYNARAESHGGHFLLDKKLVTLPGQTPFEPCDLLSADGRFMHVKRKTTSSTMSHVITQALASTRLLRGEAAARKKLDGVLKGSSPPPSKLADMRAHCDSFGSTPTGRVSIVIVGSWRGKPDVTQLPLLTRIALNSWLRDMPCARDIVLVGT